MELIKRVEELLLEIDKTHKYSMSRIYGLYNEVFGIAETPQSCASCLLRKTSKLREWFINQTNNITNKIDDAISSKPNVGETETSSDLQKKKRGRKPKSV